jgi:hypothetical protein
VPLLFFVFFFVTAGVFFDPSLGGAPALLSLRKGKSLRQPLSFCLALM